MHEVYYNQIKYLEFPETGRITPSVNDRSYIVRAGQEGRLDVIAKEVYGDPSRWQVIANANDIFNPFLEMYAGMPLRIPPLEEL
jgi:nucleoid-associated protein YgaU